VTVEPCVNYYKNSKKHWVDTPDSIQHWGLSTELCFHNEGVSEKATADFAHHVGDGYDAILNEDGVCKRCCRYERDGYVLTPMDEEELERCGLTEESSMGAVGAMGIIPVLLDPSMVSMVALGAAMAIGLFNSNGPDWHFPEIMARNPNLKAKTTEEPTSCVPACIAEAHDRDGPSFGNDSGDIRGQHFDTCHNIEERITEQIGEDYYTGEPEYITYSQIKCNCLDIAVEWYEESEYVRRVLKGRGSRARYMVGDHLGREQHRC
jgi:hypothetical protein